MRPRCGDRNPGCTCILDIFCKVEVGVPEQCDAKVVSHFEVVYQVDIRKNGAIYPQENVVAEPPGFDFQTIANVAESSAHVASCVIQGLLQFLFPHYSSLESRLRADHSHIRYQRTMATTSRLSTVVHPDAS